MIQYYIWEPTDDETKYIYKVTESITYVYKLGKPKPIHYWRRFPGDREALTGIYKLRKLTKVEAFTELL